jgi:hypothetical protein
MNNVYTIGHSTQLLKNLYGIVYPKDRYLTQSF